MHIVKHPLWSRFRTIAWPFFTSSMRARAIVVLTVMVVLLVSINGVNFISSYVMRDFMTSLEQRHAEHLYGLGALLAAVFGIASIAEAFAFYAEQRLGLLWREWLTHRLIDRYLAHRAYHQLTVNQSIDNPDQRISEDTRTFTTSSLSFLVLITNGLLTLVAFLGVLWSITPWLVLTAVLYAAAGSLGTILLGRRLVPLNNRQLQKEADFRFALVRVRQRADTDSQREDAGADTSSLRERLQAVVANFRDIIGVTRNVGFFTKEYNYLIQIIPAVVVAPLYVRGQVDFGVIPQAAMAFTAVVGAFSLIVTKFQEVSTFAAVVNRLGSMWEATESSGAPHEPTAPAKEAEPAAPPLARVVEGERIRYESLTLWTPGHKRVLIRELTLEVPEGKRLLITGPSSCGKTALCLATAGQWGAGCGQIISPPPEHIRFLPQRIYTASGRLRDLLLGGLVQEEMDDRLRDVLRDVGLNYLADQKEGLDSEWDWPNDLSIGDQHALALARLLLVRPRFAFLDGVPWGLPPARLERLYAALARTSITYISAGNAASLLPYHARWLKLQEDGHWQLQDMTAGKGDTVSEQAASAG